MKTVFKPWGKEVWLELNEKYCYKRIYINAGYKTSYQYHEFKRETNYIISGTAEIWLENDEGIVEKKIMKAGDYFNVTPPKKHRVIAITDLILQEVSTPEVDDVIRLEDDTNRVDGKITGEHKTPGVFILAAGKGTRLKHLTDNINKALLPINNEAVISKIIKKFPSNYKFVIAVGYKGELIKEYCSIAFPTYDITFVNIDDIESHNSGPGYSALKCKELLQRPFYLTTVDCLLTSELPYLDSNWLGLHSTAYPEKYSTAKLKNGVITEFENKAESGFDLAFIGLAGILDYSTFWSELEQNIVEGEIVTAFFNPSKYGNLKGKELEWLDTGNLDDLEKARLYFNDKPLSLNKTTKEIIYHDNGKVIKYIPNPVDVLSLKNRAVNLKELVPDNVSNTTSFLFYDWVEGETLYSKEDFGVYTRFIIEYLENIVETESDVKDTEEFYQTKTKSRYNKFLSQNNPHYSITEFKINGKTYPSMDYILQNLDLDSLNNTKFTLNFHGDLQFDNIIVSNNKYRYIDWRRNFGSSTKAGDVYYDLAKMYGGINIPYNLMKDENNIELTESSTTVEYRYKQLDVLSTVKGEFEYLVQKYGYDLDRIKVITGLIYLNMSPMHYGKFSKLLWFKAITILANYANK